MIFASIFAFIGIILNWTIIMVIFYKPNRKSLKENQYKYMAANAAINALILFIASTKVLSECELFGFYCSSIRKYKFIQIYRIIVGEYLSSALRLMSNMTYVGFAINRLSLIGKNHASFVTYICKLKMSEFFIRFMTPCFVISLVNAFNFLLNNHEPDDDYPIPIAHFFINLDRNLINVYLSFSFIFQIVDCVFFLFVNLLFDILSVFKLRAVLAEKKEKIKKLGLNQEKNG